MAGIGFGVVQATNARTPQELAALEGVMQTPEEVLVMRQLLEPSADCGGAGDVA